MSEPLSDEKPVSLVFRIPKSSHEALRELSRRTRIRQSEYLREAVENLLQKYEEKPVAPAAAKQDANE